MPGITVKSDNAPALYYRPGHVPGNEPTTVHALMCGYPKEARAYEELTENKSHGQQSQHRGEWDDKAYALLKLTEIGDSVVPLILMDEPEQSLDTKAELNLWNRIVEADCNVMQVIVATHSMYPFLHPERFNLIETEPGYLNSVLALLKEHYCDAGPKRPSIFSRKYGYWRYSLSGA